MSCCTNRTASIRYQIVAPDGTKSDKLYRTRSEANENRGPDDRVKPVRISTD